MNQIMQQNSCGALGGGLIATTPQELFEIKTGLKITNDFNCDQLQQLQYTFDQDKMNTYFANDEVPKTLAANPALMNKFLQLIFQNLNLDASKDKLSVIDTSGMSNPVFIVNAEAKPNDKVIIRFFYSQAADFVMENTIFGVTSSKGLSPNIKQSDYSTYRIEEYYDGKVFDYSELSQQKVVDLTMKLLSNFNYNKDLFNINPGADLKANEFIYDEEKGWYWQALNETKPLFEKINKMLQGTENPAWKKCYEVFKQIDRVFFQDREAFFKEYIELLPSLNEDSIVRESVVFCHNDTQENNFMHAFSFDDQGEKQIHDVKIIDFEYSGINHRGADLAGYIIEACINYNVDKVPKYEIDESKFPAFDGPAKEGTVDLNFLITTYLTNFYENHLPGLIEDYKDIDKFQSLEAYLAREVPVLKSQLKGLILNQHLIWVAWCLIMTRGSLIDKATGNLVEDPAQLQQVIQESADFNMPYALSRLQLYFKHREMFGLQPSAFQQSMI